jgi:hypothetical protein
MFKTGQIFKSKCGTEEVEIMSIDPISGRVKFVHRDAMGVMSQWDDPEIVQMLIDTLGMTIEGNEPFAYKKICWHNNKVKKWLLTTFYWKCLDCGEEFEND